MRPDPKRKESSTLKRATELIPELGEYHEPYRDAESELISLCLQSGAFDPCMEPVERRKAMMDSLVEQYGLVGPEELPLREVVVREIHNLKPDASPGAPFMRVCPTNADVIEMVGVEALADLVLQRLELWSHYTVEELKNMDPLTAVKLGLRDPVRVMVKAELHTTKKMDQRRMRIINCVSLLDQVCERTYCAKQNQAEIKRHHVLPSQPGMGLHDEGLCDLRDKIWAMSNPISSDVTGWDWSVSDWVMDWDMEYRAISAGMEFEGSVYQRMSVLFSKSLFTSSNGWAYCQLKPGIMLSGRYNTSSTNSRGRRIMAALVADNAKSVCLTMGDDCIEDNPKWTPEKDAEYIARYRSYGFKLKGVNHSSVTGYAEFCSYRFDKDGTVTPDRWAKAAATYFAGMSTQPNLCQSQLMALNHELRFCAHRVRVLEVAALLLSEASRGGLAKSQ